VRRVFSAAPVLFKGSGFYVTDSRRPAARKEEKPKAGAAGDSGAPKAEGAPKTEGTPKTDAKGDKAAESAA